MKPAYYNENDKIAAQWLRNLIAAGHIAPGDVDERSIEDVTPNDLTPYAQCHFFAGVGVWSYALRKAGWPDDKRVWTGSCPCQPFSASGQGNGFADERHLWPHWNHLIEVSRPAIILGEQVASKDAGPWIDLVHADLEAMEYAFGCVPFPSAGVGAPHIRDRAYWVALARLDDADLSRLEGHGWGHPASFGQREAAVRSVTSASQSRSMADASERAGQSGEPWTGERGFSSGDGCGQGSAVPGPTNGFWRSADWLFCRDEQWRPVEPGTFPLADVSPGRMGRLHAYGNAINVEAAKVFVEVVMDSLGYGDL